MKRFSEIIAENAREHEPVKSLAHFVTPFKHYEYHARKYHEHLDASDNAKTAEDAKFHDEATDRHYQQIRATHGSRIANELAHVPNDERERAKLYKNM